MTPVEAAGIGRAIRLFLLLSTVFGLAAMHTLGHAGVHVGTHGHTAATAGVASPEAGETAAAGSADHCPDGHCPGRDHGGMSGWAICLAVLGGLTAAVLLAALLLTSRPGPLGWGPGRPFAPSVPRPPPRRWMGLTVASVAVLRI
ncbi:hypothetical protein [Actinoplanes sp. NPDC049316]|uniref:hypothetical protein n=1 Tax=Actinoplanes sp. NPDC049316 TaxID=3154727 RepID=UPI0034253ABE